jgi:hypothetical protein
MTNEDVIFIANVFIGGLFVSMVGFAVAWMRARERAIRAEAKARPVEESSTRLERLQQSVDSIAIEVERVAEAQRFSARLLAEQKQLFERHRLPERVITPH